MLRTIRVAFLASATSVLMCWMGTTAMATPVVFEFTGTATFQNGDFTGQGTAVSGTFQLDDGLADSNANSGVASYNKTLPANAPLAGTFAYSITLGAVTSTGNGSTGTTAFLTITDDSTQASDSVTLNIGTAPSDILSLRALTGSGTDVELPGIGFNPMADALAVLAGLDPSAFGSAPSYWGAGANQVQFTLNSVTQVPEPSTALLIGLGLIGVRVIHRRRD